MSDNKAGIELILSAPNVKGIMDDVIDDWKEISRQEKLATEQLERYNEEARAQQEHMKKVALENQKIKDAMKQLEDQMKKNGQLVDEQIDKELFAAEHQQKGIFASIKAYFAQSNELKRLGNEIDNVEKAAQKLQLRQEAISLSARRGNTAAIKEYTDNEKAIKKLGVELGKLNERYNDQAARLEFTKSKFAGFTKVFNVVKAGAVAVAASVAVIGAVTLAALYAIGRQNDQVQNQFDKVKKSASRVKTALSDAFAPIAYTFGKIFEGLLDRFANFLEQNGTNIFKWSAHVGGIIAGTFKLFGVGINNTILWFRKMGAEIDVLVATIRAGNALVRGDLQGYGLAVADLALANVKLEEANKAFDARKDAFEEAKKTAKEAEAEILALGEAYFGTRNLTDEQRKAIQQLRAEYAKLRAELSKQIEALNVKEAGPFAGLLLKADLDVREIQALGEKAVDAARKLGKSAEEINQIEKAVARLAGAVRDEAIRTLESQAFEKIDELQLKLESLRAKRTGREDILKLTSELEAIQKEFQAYVDIQQVLLQDALNKGESIERINFLLKGLRQAEEISNELQRQSELTFFSDAALANFERERKTVETRLKSLKELSEKLSKSLDQIGPDSEEGKSILIQLKVNEKSVSIAEEQIRQFESAFQLFKETGVLGVVETEARIKVKLDNGITDIKPNLNPQQAGKTGKKGPGFFESTDTLGKISEGLDTTAQLYGIAFGTISNIVLNSIDLQIAAIDRLAEARANDVDDLENQLEIEASLKAAGIANDYALVKKQLEDARRLEEESQKKQEELNKKRAKIQQQQNDAETASSLITAVANIIKGWSTVPIAGTILGIAAAAGMLVSFAAAKIQAAKIARAYKGSRRMGETFGEFAPGEGYDDTPGADRGLSVVDKNGQLRGFVGGDEFMHKQSVSRRHRKAFEYLNENEDRFKNVNLLQTLKYLEANPRQVFTYPDFSAMPHVDYGRITAKNERLLEKLVVVNNRGGITKEDLKEAVREVIKEQTETMIAYHESRPDIIPNDWLKDYTERTSKSKKQFKKG